MTDAKRPTAKGRGSQINPPNRFGGPHHEIDFECLEHDAEYMESLLKPATEYIPDRTKTIVSENDSPDVGFRYSINPYRGCSHGCSYCYARPTHEYLGFSAGLDFETKVMVKEDAPVLFREFLSQKNWVPEPIALSGVTDCYQPAERHFKLTRRCLEVAAEFGQPMIIVTKNALVLRDLDLLRDLASQNLVHVNISVTTLDAELARSMEPRTSTPAARLRAMRVLSDAGIPVRLLMAPIIPGLNESEIPAVLAASKDAGATGAGYILLRLPLTVAPVFWEWLERTYPDRFQRVQNRIRAVRDGKFNDPRFGTRMSGTGEFARRIADLFCLFRKRHGLDGKASPLDSSRFLRPQPKFGQLHLFEH
jgi:DNA repair photolyase